MRCRIREVAVAGSWPWRKPMRIAMTAPLFAWAELEDSPSLKTIREFLAAIPDGKLLAALHAWRGKGRDDYPVSALWGVTVLTVALRLREVEACLAELRRNPPLRRLIGIESEGDVPKPWNLSRFEAVLGQEPHLTLLREVFDALVRLLGVAVPVAWYRPCIRFTAVMPKK